MEESQLIITILLGTSVLLLMAGFFLFFFIRYRTKSNQYIREREKLKKDFEQALLQSQVEVQENTFAELGRELHDNIGQLLVSAKTLIAVTQRNMPGYSDTLQMAEETVGKTIHEIRQLSKSLDKEWLQQFNLIDNLCTEVNRITALQTFEVHFSHPEKILLQPEEQLILFRIVQEALQNSVKHSNAKQINISISHSAASLIINVSDDGNGFEESIINAGLGLKNMRYRTQLLGGTIELNSSPAEGSAVIIKLPVKKSR